MKEAVEDNVLKEVVEGSVLKEVVEGSGIYYNHFYRGKTSHNSKCVFLVKDDTSIHLYFENTQYKSYLIVGFSDTLCYDALGIKHLPDKLPVDAKITDVNIEIACLQ